MTKTWYAPENGITGSYNSKPVAYSIKTTNHKPLNVTIKCAVPKSSPLLETRGLTNVNKMTAKTLCHY